MYLRYLLPVLVLIGACHNARRHDAHAGAPPPTGASAAPISELHRLPLAGRLPSTHAAGAVWVEGRPLLINRPFDFSFALMGELGPAIAAGIRHRANLDVAARLVDTPGLTGDSLLARLGRACDRRCTALSGRKVRFFALLFGEDPARLHTYLELARQPERPAIRLRAVSAPRPLEGSTGWLADRGAAVTHAFHSAVDAFSRSPRLLTQDVRNDQPTVGDCRGAATTVAHGEENRADRCAEAMARSVQQGVAGASSRRASSN